MPLDCKSLLTTLDVIGSRTVGEPKLLNRPIFIDEVDNTAGTQGPNAKSPRPDRHHRTGCDRDVIGHYFYPAEIELLPVAQRRHCALVDFPASSQTDAVVIDYETRRGLNIRSTDA